jgi:uncharacterized membrane protein YcjF (UPF0283 family)
VLAAAAFVSITSFSLFALYNVRIQRQSIQNQLQNQMHQEAQAAAKNNFPSPGRHINQLGAAAQEIAQNAANTSRQASTARNESENARQIVELTLGAMKTLSENTIIRFKGTANEQCRECVGQ